MIQVAVGILIRNSSSSTESEVLICQRIKSGRYPLKWEFPGGKVETGETGEECLRRELFEELEIHPGIIEPYHHQQHSYADSGAFDVTYYLVASFTDTLINRVFELTAWVPISQLGNYDILEGNMDVISKLLAGHEAA